MVDGGDEVQYEYTLTETLLIDKELIFKKSNESRYNPNITMKVNLKECNIPVVFFKISKNFSLNFFLYPTEDDDNGQDEKQYFPLIMMGSADINVTRIVRVK